MSSEEKIPKLEELYQEIEGRYGRELEIGEKDLLSSAYGFAKEAHSGQTRKSGEPYFNHVFYAAKNCADLAMDITTIVAAILHDTIEDTSVTDQDVIDAFGEEIHFLVDGVTKLGHLKYRGRERHVESLRKFFVAVAKDLRVVIIKLADRLHNLSTLEHLPEDKQKRIAIESLEIHAPLAGRLGMGKLASKIQELAFPFAYPKEHDAVKALLKTRKKSDQRYVQKVFRSLKKELASQGMRDVNVHYRVKGLFSLYKKLQRKDMNIDLVHDIIALRVIVASVEDCYRVLGIIHTMWKPLPGRVKDYIAIPKPNGYQSLHTTIFTGDGGTAEIQIRTHEMHQIAEYGIASHFGYKQGTLKDKKQKYYSLDWLSSLVSERLDEGKLTPDLYLNMLTTDFFNDRIFVYTPMGDVVDLPQGSTVIDFAYAIHSDIGNHMSGAWINDRYSSIKTELRNRDIVKIQHNPQSTPKSKWIESAKTTLAQKHIRSYLRKHSSSTTLGRWLGM